MSGSRMGVPQMNGNNRRPNTTNRNPSVENSTNSTTNSSTSSNNASNLSHEYLIKYILDSWNQVSQEVDRNSGNRAVYYQEQENQTLKDFEPFDLEAYWGRRVVQNLESNS